MIYTIIPHNQVFSERGQASNHKRIEIEGIPMLVEPFSHTSWKIIKLLSTDPAHYLKGQYKPGTIIDLSSLIKLH